MHGESVPDSISFFFSADMLSVVGRHGMEISPPDSFDLLRLNLGVDRVLLSFCSSLSMLHPFFSAPFDWEIPRVRAASRPCFFRLTL